MAESEAASLCKRLVKEAELNGSLRVSDVEPLFLDPEARSELGALLARVESTGAKWLPDESKMNLEPVSLFGRTGLSESADDHPYQVYRRLVAEVPPLSGDRELQLLGNIAVGASDANAAKKELVEANLAVVISIAADYRCSGLEILELIEIGNYGLMYAVDTFVTGRGPRVVNLRNRLCPSISCHQ